MEPDNRPGLLSAAVRRGTPIAAAFRIAGFTDKQQQEMLAADPDLRQLLDGKSAEYQQELLKYIQKAAQHDWKAASFLLQNHPDHRETFAAPKTDPVVQVVLLYDRDGGASPGRRVIDVPGGTTTAALAWRRARRRGIKVFPGPVRGVSRLFNHLRLVSRPSNPDGSGNIGSCVDARRNREVGRLTKREIVKCCVRGKVRRRFFRGLPISRL